MVKPRMTFRRSEGVFLQVPDTPETGGDVHAERL